MKKSLAALLAVLLTLLVADYSGATSLDIDEQQIEPAQLELTALAQSAEAGGASETRLWLRIGRL